MGDDASPLPFDAIWRQVVGPIAVLDLQARHVDVNPAMCRMLGYDRDELIKRDPVDVIHPDDEPVGRQNVDRLLAGEFDSFPVEVRLLHSDGSVLWVLVQTSLIRDDEGAPALVVCQFHDITRYRELLLLWRQTVSNAPIGMALLDLDGSWTEVNEKLCELVGYDREELVGSPCTGLVDDAEDQSQHRSALTALREGRETSATLEVRFRHRDGDQFWLLTRLSVVPGADDQPVYLVGQYESLGGGARLSEERLDRLTRMALHDPLTGLANRALLIDRLEHELAELGERGGVLAVLVIDLDRFKPVNDQYGHPVGDQLLIAVAQELISAVRGTDTVARFGGDEFVVVARVPDFAEADALRDRVVQRLVSDAVVCGRSLSMCASVGLSTTQNPKTPGHFLIGRADQDMYRVKHRHRG